MAKKKATKKKAAPKRTTFDPARFRMAEQEGATTTPALSTLGDERLQATAKAQAEKVATSMPKVNPKTGQLPDLFTGKFGFVEILANDPIYGEEIRAIKAALEAGNETLALSLLRRSKWARLDTDAQERYLLNLQNSDLYKERLKSWLARIKPQLLERGLKADDATLEKYYKDGIDDEVIFDELAGGISAKGAAGDIGSALDALRKVARNNGFDLDKDFGTQIDGWLQRIARGESVEDFARLIRQQAKLGLPDKIGALLDEGLDLANVFAPYRSTMATLLETPLDSISLNDPILRSAFGPDKEMSIYEFQRKVRRDPRWQYTNNARQEVSESVLGVLRDFGFQG